MYSRQNRISKKPSDSHDAPASNQFAPRPFVVQPQTQEVKPPENQTADLQAKEEKSNEELEEHIENNSKCIAARNQMNNKCFRGGDAGHQEALQIAINSLNNCHRVRERVKAKQPQPQTSPDFIKKMSAITGLSGAALAAYLILSEGSRVFPPRNLIPVP